MCVNYKMKKVMCIVIFLSSFFAKNIDKILSNVTETNQTDIFLKEGKFLHQGREYTSNNKLQLILSKGILYAPVGNVFYKSSHNKQEVLYLLQLESIYFYENTHKALKSSKAIRIPEVITIVGAKTNKKFDLLKYRNNLYIPIINENTPREIPILMYHHITKNPNEWNSIRVSPKKFREDLRVIKQKGYESILPEQIVDYRNKKTILPEKPIMITFDDGYSSNYTEAFPILKEMNMKAVISIIGSKVGRKDLELARLSWEQAKEMYKSGYIAIQPHSYNLHIKTKNWEEQGVRRQNGENDNQYKKRIKEDTLRIMALIKEKVGEDTVIYTYPYGIITKESEAVMKELGIPITLSIKEGTAYLDNDMYSLPRYNVPQSLPMKKLLQRIEYSKKN